MICPLSSFIKSEENQFLFALARYHCAIISIIMCWIFVLFSFQLFSCNNAQNCMRGKMSYILGTIECATKCLKRIYTHYTIDVYRYIYMNTKHSNEFPKCRVNVSHTPIHVDSNRFLFLSWMILSVKAKWKTRIEKCFCMKMSFVLFHCFLWIDTKTKWNKSCVDEKTCLRWFKRLHEKFQLLKMSASVKKQQFDPPSSASSER